MGAHLIDGTFQSDKYPTCPRGKVPLSVKDKDAQDLLWQYAERHRKIDCEFSGDLSEALLLAGYQPPDPSRTEVDRIARVMIREWERVEGGPPNERRALDDRGKVNVSYIATFADMARAVLVELTRAPTYTPPNEHHTINFTHTLAEGPIGQVNSDFAIEIGSSEARRILSYEWRCSCGLHGSNPASAVTIESAFEHQNEARSAAR